MKQRVLFLCTGNSARSQMAEGWLQHLAGDRYEALSAGTHPVGLNPGSVEAMAEVGVDISFHRSKNVSEFMGQPRITSYNVCYTKLLRAEIFSGLNLDHLKRNLARIFQ